MVDIGTESQIEMTELSDFQTNLLIFIQHPDTNAMTCLFAPKLLQRHFLQQQTSTSQCTQQKALITTDLKQTGSQLLQLLLQLIPDLRQTLTLLVL